MDELELMQRKIDSVRREIRNLIVMGMDPKQKADQLVLIRHLEASARAELKLRVDALEC